MIFEIAIPFLALGSASFLICAAIPQLRRFALSTSLWCLAFAFCLIAVVIALLFVSTGFAALHELFHRHSVIDLSNSGQTSWAGWLFIIFSVAAATTGATAITAVHGIITRRLTLALFRLYLAVVSFGVGLVSFAFVLLVYINLLFDPYFVVPVTIVGLSLMLLLSYMCFRNASQFRGSYPERFPVVTHEEFGFDKQRPA